MKKSIAWWQTLGFLFTCVFGTLLHFVFDWSGGSVLAALFSAVNESIWEHLKLLYFPMFFFALIEYRFAGKRYPQYWCVKLMGLLLGLILIPVIYYTYTGIFGVSLDWLNITIFFLAAGVSFLVEYRLLKHGYIYRITPQTAFVLICTIGLLFIVLTFKTPRLPFFKDPVTNGFGYVK